MGQREETYGSQTQTMCAVLVMHLEGRADELARESRDIISLSIRQV